MEGREYFTHHKRTTIVLLLSTAFVTIVQKILLQTFIKFGVLNDSEDYLMKYLFMILTAFISYLPISLVISFESHIDAINFFKKIADLRLFIAFALLIPATKRYFMEVSGSIIDNSTAFMTIIFLLVTCYIIERTIVATLTALASQRLKIKSKKIMSPELYFDVVYIPLSYIQNMLIGVSIALFIILLVTMALWGTENLTGVMFVNEISDFLYHIYMYPL
ncbi:MAG: hypothetical protein DRN30_02855 [Thermoplasmata archaeon]|nr:MAG: hypothetical protein DRN30_02855 [Thermoplasmata archaeon]